MKHITILLVVLIQSTSYVLSQEALLLKDFEPVAVYNIPKSTIDRAKYPVVDFHTHQYAESEAQLDEWVRNMDAAGITKAIVLTGSTGKAFDSIYNMYSKYPDHFELWCGIDFSGYQEPGWSEKAIKELERCHEVGAKGVGELGDKGEGLWLDYPVPAYGLHFDDTRMQPVLQRCGELNMPVNIHVADPYWMYLPMDKYNDGLMNAYTWRIDTSKKDILLHSALVKSLENAVKANPRTTFIACHLANCSHDLNMLGRLLETYPNLYADIGARFAEIAPIPRHAKAFIENHQDKLLYGTDMGMSSSMYQITFRILETRDEHFYAKEHFSYHWPLNGLDLSDVALEKLYFKNSLKILKK